MILIIDDIKNYTENIVTMLQESGIIGNISVAMDYEEDGRLFS